MACGHKFAKLKFTNHRLSIYLFIYDILCIIIMYYYYYYYHYSDLDGLIVTLDEVGHVQCILELNLLYPAIT